MPRMLDCGQEATALLGRLVSPARNRYYYGKLLDAFHFNLEQDYGNRQRWLLNRLSLGTGVLCGLEVVQAREGKVRVSPGVAIDGTGREIVVPEMTKAIDPRQPTDDCGRPVGDPIRDDWVTLQLCYHECEAEPAPVLVADACEPEHRCENGMIRERYRPRIVAGRPDDVPGIVNPDQCGAIFAEPPRGSSRRQVVCEKLSGPCVPPRSDCVTLATISLTRDGEIKDIDQCTYRNTVYSNAVLLDLILCLAERVDRCCGALDVKVLQRISKSPQDGRAGQRVQHPPVVRVVEGGRPVEGEEVTFDNIVGGGAIGLALGPLRQEVKIPTGADGLARLPVWELGPDAGDQEVSAHIDNGAPGLVTFRAEVEPVKLDLPVVWLIWPPNAAALSAQDVRPEVHTWFKQWQGGPRLEITFNHEMSPGDLKEPHDWLRVFMIPSAIRAIGVAPLTIRYAQRVNNPVLPGSGFTEVFAIESPQPPAEEYAVRFLVIIKAEGGNIVDTSGVLLDAEFDGTALRREVLDYIWNLQQSDWLPQEVWDSLIDTGQRLPHSGNRVEGGLFHSWFEVSSG